MSTRAAIKITKGGRTAWFYRHAEGGENALGLELLDVMRNPTSVNTMSNMVQRIIMEVPDVTLTDEQPDYVYYGYLMDLDAMTLKCYYLIDRQHPGWRDENEVPIRRENGFVGRMVTVRRGNEYVLAYCAGIEREGKTDYFHFLTIGGDRFCIPLIEADVRLMRNAEIITEKVVKEFRRMVKRKEDGV